MDIEKFFESQWQVTDLADNGQKLILADGRGHRFSLSLSDVWDMFIKLHYQYMDGNAAEIINNGLGDVNEAR